jgi:HAD superfamily hydrolase (TIGR01509 family)
MPCSLTSTVHWSTAMSSTFKRGSAPSKALSHDIPVERIRKQIGKGADMLIPALLPDVSGDHCKAIATAHGSIFKSFYLDHVTPFPRAHDLVEAAAARGMQVVLASSASKEELQHYIELLAIGRFVHTTVCADDVQHSKPAADIFKTALEKVAPLPAADILAVGDTPYDVESAGKVGIRTLGLLSGPFTEAELKAANAIAIYKDAADLLNHLSDLPL